MPDFGGPGRLRRPPCGLRKAADTLGIAEGMETALSAAALFGPPCWAALNATLLQAGCRRRRSVAS